MFLQLDRKRKQVKDQQSLSLMNRIVTERRLETAHFSNLVPKRLCFLIPIRVCNILLPDCSTGKGSQGIVGLKNGHQMTSAPSALENNEIVHLFSFSGLWFGASATFDSDYRSVFGAAVSIS